MSKINTCCLSQLSARLGMGVGYFWLYLAEAELRSLEVQKACVLCFVDAGSAPVQWLVGGIATPLNNRNVNWDDYSEYMEK